MAYLGIDSWEAVLAPAYKARIGEPDAVEWDEDWDDFGGRLDAWGEMGQAEEQQEQPEAELPTMADRTPLDFSDEPNEGWRQADRNAAMKGVDPRRQGAGAGQLFDLAKSFLGTPYVFGAAGPEAFDCSGFTQYLFGRVYGTSLPHNAAAQFSATKRVAREELQPGDLIFYAYGRLGKGVVDHVEVFMGNGKQIGTSNPNEDLDIDNVDWNNVVGFGRAAGTGGQPVAGAVDSMGKKPKAETVYRPVRQDPAAAVEGLTSEGGLASVLAGILTDDVVAIRRTKTPKFGGPQGTIKQQLYRGFIDAGREDLARMVRTKDFATWIQAESGWRPGVASPANNHGLANDGLFQVWRGHDFNDRGQVGRMSPYEQAQIIAKYFSHLTPEAIRRYAEEIRAGRYHGWG